MRQAFLPPSSPLQRITPHHPCGVCARHSFFLPLTAHHTTMPLLCVCVCVSFVLVGHQVTPIADSRVTSLRLATNRRREVNIHGATDWLCVCVCVCVCVLVSLSMRIEKEEEEEAAASRRRSAEPQIYAHACHPPTHAQSTHHIIPSTGRPLLPIQ